LMEDLYERCELVGIGIGRIQRAGMKMVWKISPRKGWIICKEMSEVRSLSFVCGWSMQSFSLESGQCSSKLGWSDNILSYWNSGEGWFHWLSKWLCWCGVVASATVLFLKSMWLPWLLLCFTVARCSTVKVMLINITTI
jgi:hypothetical protein